LVGGINLYAYTANSPINRIDQYGLDAGIISGPMAVYSAMAAGTAATIWWYNHKDQMAEDLGRFWNWLWNENTEDDEQCPVDPPDYPDDPSSPPGPDWEWRGPENKGAWHKKNPKESLRPHPEGPDNPHGEHYDWKDSNKEGWRIYPDGRIEHK
jgi:hypothetical protein